MALIRLLIFAFLAFLLYRLIKGLIQPSQRLRKSAGGGAIDEMVQDPQCMVYIPKREAYKKAIKGKEYYFCSEECAKKFEQGIKHESH